MLKNKSDTLDSDQKEKLTKYIKYVETRVPQIAVYAGSFDPLHIGHYNIIQQAEKQFDKVIILLAVNASKNITSEIMTKRVEKVKEVLPYHEVDVWNHLLSDY